MAKLVEDEKEVTKFLAEKQMNEVELSDALLKTYGSAPLIDKLREIAAVGLSELIEFHEATRDVTSVIQKAMIKALQDENKANMNILKNLGMPKQFKVEKPNVIELPAALPSILKNQKTWGPAECSDIVRLYGTMVEKLSALTDDGGAFQFHMSPQRKKDLDTFGAWSKKNAGALKEFQAIVDQSFKDNPKAIEALKGFKALDEIKKAFRLDVGDSTGGKGAVWNTDKLLAYGRHRTAVGSLKDADKAEAIANMTEVQAWLKTKKGGGALLFKLEDSSTIGKLDRLLGLVPAADISGTTSDTIFFFEKLFTSFATHVDKVFYMLPAATIVGGNHHSMLEVAMPMTHNGIINYKVGQYTSLLPAGASLGADKVTAVLTKHEKDPRNRNMFVFYSAKSKAAGAYVCEPGEAAAFQKFVDGKTLMQTAQKMKEKIPGWPSKEEVTAIVKDQAKLKIG